MRTHSYFFKRAGTATGIAAALWLFFSGFARAEAPLPRGGTVHPAPTETSPVRTLASATLAATGDVLMHGAVKDAAADHRAQAGDEGYAWLYAPISDLLGASDLTFANLETPVAPHSGTGSKAFVFNAPPSAVRALRGAGVGAVSVANNHAFDQGRAGFVETMAEVERAGVIPVGGGEAPDEPGPRVIERNGLRIALFGWAHFFNQDGNDCPPREPRCVKAAQLDRERAVALVREAAPRFDAVVVSVHWGDEYASQPRAEDVALARRLCDAGAIAVIGHHPHVLQPIEIYRRADGKSAVIAYSLGNFISNQSRNYVQGVTPAKVAATRDGALLRFTIARRDYGRGVQEVELAGVEYWPLWTENDTAERRTPGVRPKIRVVSLHRALDAVRTELAALPDPVAPADRARYEQLRRREELYVARRRAIAEVLGEDLEGTPPPAPPSAPAATSTAR